MNVSLLKVVSLLALALGAAAAHAGGWQSAFSANGYTVGADTNGSRVYVFPSQPLNPDNCSGGGGQIRIDGSLKRGQYHVAMVSMAVASNKKLTANLSGCDDWGYPVVLDLALQP